MNTKFYKESQTKSFKIDGGTTGFIYPDHPKGQCTVARIKMSGEYPIIGYSVNKICTETLIVMRGTFKVRVDNNVYKIKPGDMLVILPKTKYRIEGKGEALDIITPRWDKKQNKIILDKKFKIKI